MGVYTIPQEHTPAPKNQTRNEDYNLSVKHENLRKIREISDILRNAQNHPNPNEPPNLDEIERQKALGQPVNKKILLQSNRLRMPYAPSVPGYKNSKYPDEDLGIGYS